MNTLSKVLLWIHGVWAAYGIVYALFDHRGSVPAWMRLPDYLFPLQVALAVSLPILVFGIGYVTRYPKTKSRTAAHGVLTTLQLFFGFLPLIS
jgi:hypothetical protein